MNNAFARSILRIGLILIASLLMIEGALWLIGFFSVRMEQHKSSAKVRKDGTYRILCLGESTTYGQYPPILEKILNEKSRTVRFTVIDKGVAGTNASEILARLDENIAAYRPHMVVAMVGINEMGHDYVVLDNEARPSVFRRLGNKSKLIRFLRICRNMVRHRDARGKITRYAETGRAHDDFRGVFVPAREHSTPALMGPYASRSVEEMYSIVGKNGKDELALAVLAFKLALRGKLPEAGSYALRAYRLKPRDPAACCILAGTFNQYGDTYRGQIEELMKRVLEKHPDDLNALLALGESYMYTKQYEKAEKLFAPAVERGRANNTLYLDLAEVYIQQKKYAEAEKVLQKLLQLESPLDLVYGSLALVSLKSRDYRSAERYFSLADGIRLNYVRPETAELYAAIVRKVASHNVTMACMQYPMRSVQPLKKMLARYSLPGGAVIFVDNEGLFKDAVRAKGYDYYFRDQFGGDFGHCTEEGNTLLARNLAAAILDTLRLPET